MSTNELQLSEEVLKKINTPGIRRELMDALGVTEFTVIRYIRKNSPNLKRYEALEVIKKRTGFTIEQILVPKEGAKK